MREQRRANVRWLPAVALAIALGSEGGSDPIGSEAWMPDVRPRIAELKSRAEEAAAQARSRRAVGKHGGKRAGESSATPGRQWWRLVAARPRDGATQ